MTAPIPDGIDIEIIQLCRYGAPGERKTISYSTAMQLIIRGYAKEYGAVSQKKAAISAPIRVIHPTVYAVKVTAICPTFNRRKYLPTSIACFLSQTLINSELLIVDDSIESVEDLVPKHPRIRYIRLDIPDKKANVGNIGHDGARMLIGAKRNFCCEHARGEFIAHWDDDDWQAPGRLADQLSQLEKSGKDVLTYHNILYWDDVTQRAARCFAPVTLRAPHGASFFYRKSFWEKHHFPIQGGGEDTSLGRAADLKKSFIVADAKEFMVVRAHGQDLGSALAGTFLNDRGNLCTTVNGFGTSSIPLVSKEEIPSAFFEPLLKEVPAALCASREDAVIGVIKHYDWPALQPYAVSLARCGFNGLKLLFVNSITQAARINLVKVGFTLIDYAAPPSAHYFDFGRHRFKPIIDFLKNNPGRFRNLVFCDVRDLIFQSDPSAWLEKNVDSGKFIVAANECYKVKDEKVCNDIWAQHVSPREYAWLKEEDVLCSGTFAGNAESMLGIFSRIYEMTFSNRDPMAADQGMFQYIVRTSPYKEILIVPRMKDGFTATWWPQRAQDEICTDDKPVFNETDGVVYTPETNVPFSIVHQYDRSAPWSEIMRKKYA